MNTIRGDDFISPFIERRLTSPRWRPPETVMCEWGLEQVAVEAVLKRTIEGVEYEVCPKCADEIDGFQKEGEMPEIKVVCSECGKELEIQKTELSKSYYPDIFLKIDPCATCIEANEKAGYDEGLADGRAEEKES